MTDHPISFLPSLISQPRTRSALNHGAVVMSTSWVWNALNLAAWRTPPLTPALHTCTGRRREKKNRKARGQDQEPLQNSKKKENIASAYRFCRTGPSRIPLAEPWGFSRALPMGSGHALHRVGGCQGIMADRLQNFAELPCVELVTSESLVTRYVVCDPHQTPLGCRRCSPVRWLVPATPPVGSGKGKVT